jgi:hypothetical protein
LENGSTRSKAGLCNGTLVIGTVCVVLGLLALRVLPETFGRNLDFDESIAR